MEKQDFLKDLKTAIMFAVSFVMLAVVIYIWKIEDLQPIVKFISIGVYAFVLFKFFTGRELAAFAGFAIMLLGLNYIWQDAAVDLIWKIAASVAVVLQIGTLGDRKSKVTKLAPGKDAA